ncbi:hypothetical protein [Ralstonia mojiangensis]|uniref:Uncharacterized protein n=1 Tax=Ralstonia mojiangensis TaxID=2953895 RepID=A0ABT2L986_9RALS|nr:hypothetical protein [Ralstonia mojiangensis]MCO5414106.1 hypothetical protein [Ralstonia mojiangensis]MCT7311980.1 hypothetical protein [Ralstonia mojiangensis]
MKYDAAKARSFRARWNLFEAIWEIAVSLLGHIEPALGIEPDREYRRRTDQHAVRRTRCSLT